MSQPLTGFQLVRTETYDGRYAKAARRALQDRARELVRDRLVGMTPSSLLTPLERAAQCAGFELAPRTGNTDVLAKHSFGADTTLLEYDPSRLDPNAFSHAVAVYLVWRAQLDGTPGMHAAVQRAVLERCGYETANRQARHRAHRRRTRGSSPAADASPLVSPRTVLAGFHGSGKTAIFLLPDDRRAPRSPVPAPPQEPCPTPPESPHPTGRPRRRKPRANRE